MTGIFVMHVNNHANRKSFKTMTSKERKKTQPSYTVVGIFEGDTIKFGVAQCNKEDSFCKKEGREIAIKKAMTQEALQVPEHIIKNKKFGTYFLTKAKRLVK